MRPDELDDLLQKAAPTPPPTAMAVAAMVAREAERRADGVAPISARSRSRWRAVAVGVACVVALTGAGTVAAYQLSVPPFSTLEHGVERAHTGIPIVYVNSLGREVDCLAFIEYQHLDSAQRSAIEKVSDDDRWAGYGQRALDQAGIPHASPEVQNDAVNAALARDLWKAAHAAVPAMIREADASGPVFNGYSFSCAKLGGVDGRP